MVQLSRIGLVLALAAGWTAGGAYAQAQSVAQSPVEAPKVEAPKAEAPKVEAPKVEAPKAEPVKTEAPKAEPEKTEPKKLEAEQAAPPPPPRVKRIRLATWGGAYGEAQTRALVQPFGAAQGAAMAVIDHRGRLGDFLSGKAKPEWDVVDLNAADLAKACADGRVLPLSPASLAASADGRPVADDFLPGGLRDCGVATVAWSSLVVFEPSAFKGRTPDSAADVFDVKRFPGKRAFQEAAFDVLALALIADGVAAGAVTQTLETDEGVIRAFAQLDRIKSEIVWWTKASEPLAMLAAKDVAFATAFNGRVFMASVAGRQPLALIWQGQIYEMDYLAVPAQAEDPDLAKAFIAYATDPARLAAKARLFPYGPARKSAIKLVGANPDAGLDMTRFLPTAPENFASAVWRDHGWLATHRARLDEALANWRAGKPVVAPKIAPVSATGEEAAGGNPAQGQAQGQAGAPSRP